ncbi:hypothetical protein ACO34A_04730 [Rhizobium sp. ACO-34A]|nr:hypothetical protein [Rhizobium sp. ACO-34A]ATN33107.1 hypothetical protein ACO34A_04730 [Rhizobium sp. ACO-34A]
MELVHSTGDVPRARGQVVGLYGFDLGGGSFAETWVRAGADIDLKVTENAVISLSGHAATEGMDAQISGLPAFRSCSDAPPRAGRECFPWRFRPDAGFSVLQNSVS